MTFNDLNKRYDRSRPAPPDDERKKPFEPDYDLEIEERYERTELHTFPQPRTIQDRLF